jgi:hypothetical protein
MRGLSTCVVLAAVLFAAGCGGGGGGGGGGSSSAAQASGEAAKPANQVVADASKAASDASSFHMSGQIHSSGKLIGVDLSLVRGKGMTGTVTVGGAKVELVLVGNDGYMRASSTFWKRYAGQAGGPGLTQLLADKWIKFPGKGAQLGSLTGPLSAKSLFKSLIASHGKLENKGETTYNGQNVVAIHDITKNATLYVAAKGAPYPVGLIKAGGRDAGTVAFDHWNEPPTLTAPKGALDFSHLGGSG